MYVCEPVVDLLVGCVGLKLAGIVRDDMVVGRFFATTEI